MTYCTLKDKDLSVVMFLSIIVPVTSFPSLLNVIASGSTNNTETNIKLCNLYYI